MDNVVPSFPGGIASTVPVEEPNVSLPTGQAGLPAQQAGLPGEQTGPPASPTFPLLINQPTIPSQPVNTFVKPPSGLPPLPSATVMPPVSAVSAPEKKNINFLVKGGWMAGPAIMVICFGFALYNFSLKPSTPPQVAIQEEEFVEYAPGKTIAVKTKAKWDAFLDNIPKNPDTVEARAGLGPNAPVLEPEKPSSFSEPVFTWSGAAAVEAGTNIAGYYVYFGPKNEMIPIFEPGYQNTVDPQKIGQYQESNTFTAKNLEKGTTYYLFVQAVSDSQNHNYRVGYEVLDREKYLVIPGKILFTYPYE